MAHAIDVIIPMYNRADCVAPIIAELEKQTFRDFRAIFVDDGSKDDTYDVLASLLPVASFDHLLIRKENGGAASARNAGVRAAEAEWILYVDSDDALHEEYIEYMYRSVSSTGADLGLCNLQMVVVGKPYTVDPKKEFACQTMTAAEAMCRYCTNWFGVVCMIIRRSILVDNQVFFDENCIYNEDAPYIADVIANTQTVSLVDQRLYVYLTHAGSLHRSPRMDKYLSALDSFSDMVEKLSRNETEAAGVFCTVGPARFYLATLRRAAVQFPYRDFKRLEERIGFARFRKQMRYLTLSQRLAGYLLLLSKPLFYCAMRLLFND